MHTRQGMKKGYNWDKWVGLGYYPDLLVLLCGGEVGHGRVQDLHVVLHRVQLHQVQAAPQAGGGRGQEDHQHGGQGEVRGHRCW